MRIPLCALSVILAVGSVCADSSDLKPFPEFTAPRAITSGPHDHFFANYFAINAWSPDNRYALVLETDIKDKLPDGAPCTLGLVDTEDGNRFIPVTTTRCWNFQEAAMAHWLPYEKDTFVFNDLRDGKFCAVVMNWRTKAERVYPFPVSAVSEDGTWAVSINYARLFLTRPDYGYCGDGQDPRKGVVFPEDDGLWRVDLRTGEAKLIVPTAAVKAQVPKVGPSGMSYLCHTVISKDGKRIYFLSRSVEQSMEGVKKFKGVNWYTTAFTCKSDGSEIRRCFPDGWGSSHFNWKPALTERDGRTMIVTCKWLDKVYTHVEFTVGEETYPRQVGGKAMDFDGHCIYTPDGQFVSGDGYWGKDFKRHWKIVRLADNKVKDVGDFFVPEPYRDIYCRCDLHPRWRLDGRQIGFNSVHEGTRQVYVMDVKNGAYGTRELTTTVRMQPGEEWRGVATYYGAEMPFTEKTKLTIDIRRDGKSNQYASLLLSNRGRVIWCDKQAKFDFADGVITVTAPEAATVTEAGTTLRDAFRFASAKYFPPSGKTPDLAFFSAPQYNTWIELTYHQNEKDVLAYADSMLANGCPPGVLMIDDTWQFDYGTWVFDPRRFDDPKGMVKKLHDKGFKVILWMCPWVSMDSPSYRLLAYGRDPDTVVRQPVGGLYLDANGKVASCDWWNGRSAMVDFTHPLGRKWFKDQLDRLVSDFGVDGFKLDGGALPHYNKGFVPHEWMSGGDQANGFAAFALKYPVCEYRHAWKLGGKPIVERLHDKSHNWKDLAHLMPDLMAGGLLGHAFMCPDMVGGGEWTTFLPGSPFDPELFIRSAQVHALCGQMQFSASPWRVLKDSAHRQIIRDLVALRGTFAPRFVELAKEAGRTGEPMIRPLDYMFPGNGYGAVRDEFVMGDFLVVAPQIAKGAASREVIVPPGTWKLDDGRVVTGPSRLTVETPLARLPHMVKVNK